MQTRKLFLTLLSLTTFILSAISYADETKEDISSQKPNKQQIDTLMQYTGGYNLPEKISNNLINQFKSSLPEVPESYWQEIADFIKENQKALEIQTYATYTELLTLEEVTLINEFYGSPAGQKLLSSMSTISQKTQQINTIWMQAVVARVEEKLKTDGYLK